MKKKSKIEKYKTGQKHKGLWPFTKDHVELKWREGPSK